MNIVVCVKNTIDEAELRADSDGRPMLQGAQTKMGTFDRNAVEEAVRQKESNPGSTVTVITVGTEEAKKTVKEAMAMGCDKAVLLLAGGPIDAVGTAYCIARAVRNVGGVDVVVCSEGASDTYQGQVGPMVAEFLGMPFLAYSRKVGVDAASKTITCEQTFDEGVRKCEAALPAVVSVVSEANEPRYPTLLQIMQAGKKPIEQVQVDSLKDSGFPQTGLELLGTRIQSSARKRMIFDGSPDEAARKLVEALKQEGMVQGR